MPTTREALLLLAFAMTPGYILLFVIRKMNAALVTTRESFGSVVQSFVGSAMVIIVAIILLRSTHLMIDQVGWSWPDNLHILASLGSGAALQLDRILLESVALSIVLAPLLGWLIGRLSRSERVDSLLQHVGADQFSLTPTAWDSHVFLREAGVEVIVGLDGDEWIAGTLGRHSAVAAAKDGGDIYLQQEVAVSDNRPNTLLGDSAGVWISGESIRYIRFFEDNTLENHQ